MIGPAGFMAAPKMTADRATTEPGGCECSECGAIFIGAVDHLICGTCVAAYIELTHEDDQRAEWYEEMRRDAFGDSK